MRKQWLMCNPLLNVAVAVLASGGAVVDGVAKAQQGPAGAGPVTGEQIEADWLRQDRVRGVPAARGPVTTVEDAAGGCDGVRNGSFGFCTAPEQRPWWQVDLGRELPLDLVLVYNRCDQEAERALHLRLLLSTDGKTWREVYRHDGSRFGGAPDGRPLSVFLKGAKARFVRIQLPGTGPLHLDEVEVYMAVASWPYNIALLRPADQSSTCAESKRTAVVATRAAEYPVRQVVQRGLRLAASLRSLGADVDEYEQALGELARAWERQGAEAPAEAKRRLYFKARWTVRHMALANPLLDFDDLVFAKRLPTRLRHMADQYLGWWSRPGGGLYVLEDWKSDSPRLRLLTGSLPPGNVLRPDISYDGTKVLFAYARYYPGLAENNNKLDKSRIPEDAFYHLYEVRLDGTGLRRLTAGRYDHFDGRYLPSGQIVMLSTRRGQFVQCGPRSAELAASAALPDSFVRCGGGPTRPVSIYTLHVMDADGGNLRAISPFESFEWTPSVAADGRVLYARWDYVDRQALPFMSLWAMRPDGSNPHAVYGNHTVNPYAIFEPRSIPGSQRLVFTASAHHSYTGGSLVLLDPNRGRDEQGPLTRLTPEVPFAQAEGWPSTFYANPYPLSEEYYLVAWSDQRLGNEDGHLGVYLYDAFGNLELIYRDAEISSMYPLPVRARRRPPVVASAGGEAGADEGRLLLLNVYQGLPGIRRGSIRQLRIVGVPPKTHPVENSPVLGVTEQDPGKFVLGTVPVEPDGSAWFRVPAGVPFFLQALDADGMAVQTMRSAINVPPGQTLTCAGCHEPRHTAPANRHVLAAQRPPSKITPGPDGSWPLEFDQLVQPVLDRHCVWCHYPEGRAQQMNLARDHAYQALVNYGQPSLRDHVMTRFRQGRSTVGACAARSSALLKLLQAGHYGVKLDRQDMDRLVTWMDTYAQKTGSFSRDQKRRLRDLRRRLAALLGPPAAQPYESNAKE